MANYAQQKSKHANFCQLEIDGKIMAEGVSISYNEDGGTQPVRTLGNEEAVEHIHNAYNVSWQINKLVWKEEAFKRFGPNVRLTSIPEFDLTATDFEGQEEVFRLVRCTLSTRSGGIQANQPIQSNVSGQAINMGADEDSKVGDFDQVSGA